MIDTNILVDIVEISDSRNISIILKQWICKILANMDKKPKGKKITVFASMDTLHDYKTGLSKSNHKEIGETIKFVFDKYLSSRLSVSDPLKIEMSLQKIKTEEPNNKKRVKDKDDEHFLRLSEKVAELKSCKDREIIFASRDRESMMTIKDVFAKNNDRMRLHTVDNLESFEKLIEC